MHLLPLFCKYELRTLWLSVATGLMATGCVTHQVEQRASYNGNQPEVRDVGLGVAVDSSNVEQVVDELLANGDLRLAPRDRESDGPLSAAKATAYASGPLNIRYAGGITANATSDRANVELYVFSMGQSDSMLVVGPPPQRRTMLIDAGETNWNSRKGCAHIRDRVQQITGKYRVDYLVVSHYHLDHTGYPRTQQGNKKAFEGGGIFCLLGSTPDFFSVGTLIDSGPADGAFQPVPHVILDAIGDGVSRWVAAGTLEFREYAKFGSSQIDLGDGVEVEIVVTGGKVSVTDPGMHALVERDNPGTYLAEQQASPNDFSVGMEISVGDFELFTAGDLTGAPGEPPYEDFTLTKHHQVYTNVEKSLVAHWQTIDRESTVEVYRANHHGSGNSSTTYLLDMLRPEVVIYSCGGKYGHPDKAVADRVLTLGADQIVTTQADWLNGRFPEKYGNGWENPVGEVRIVVPTEGGEFTVSSASQAWSYPIRSDIEEAAD